MIICISGPYSADTQEKRKRNLDKLNEVAASVAKLGHVPIVGVNAALPIVNLLAKEESYEMIMSISMAVTQCCDALMLIAESPGALRERDLVASRGLPIYTSVEEIPRT